MNLWNYQPDNPEGQLLGQSLDYAVRHHPDLLAINTEGMKKLVTQLGLADSDIDVLNLAGKFNSGLAWVRVRLLRR